jgi:hypothetical protein
MIGINGFNLISDLGNKGKLEGVLRIYLPKTTNGYDTLNFTIFDLNKPYALIERLIRSRFYYDPTESCCKSYRYCLANLDVSLSRSRSDSRKWFNNFDLIGNENYYIEDGAFFMEERILFHYNSSALALVTENVIEISWMDLREKLDYIYKEEEKRVKSLIKEVESLNEDTYMQALYNSLRTATIDYQKLIGVPWFRQTIKTKRLN